MPEELNLELGNQDAPETGADSTDAQGGGQETPPQVEAVQLTDDQLVEFTVNGKTVREPWSKVRQTQAMLPAAFTQKTQQLADQRRQAQELYTKLQSYEQTMQQRERAINEALADPDRLGALWMAAQAKRGQAPAQRQPGQAPAQQPAFDPNQLLEAVRYEVNTSLSKARQEQQEETLNRDLESWGRDQMKGTRLAKIRGADNLLWGEVVKMQPDSLEQTHEYARLVIKELNEQLESEASGAAATATAEAAKAARGIEPNRGSPPPPPKREYKGLDDPQRREDLISFFQQRMAD